MAKTKNLSDLIPFYAFKRALEQIGHSAFLLVLVETGGVNMEFLKHGAGGWVFFTYKISIIIMILNRRYLMYEL